MYKYVHNRIKRNTKQDQKRKFLWEIDTSMYNDSNKYILHAICQVNSEPESNGKMYTYALSMYEKKQKTRLEEEDLV